MNKPSDIHFLAERLKKLTLGEVMIDPSDLGRYAISRRFGIDV